MMLSVREKATVSVSRSGATSPSSASPAPTVTAAAAAATNTLTLEEEKTEVSEELCPTRKNSFSVDVPRLSAESEQQQDQHKPAEEEKQPTTNTKAGKTHTQRYATHIPEETFIDYFSSVDNFQSSLPSPYTLKPELKDSETAGFLVAPINEFDPEETSEKMSQWREIIMEAQQQTFKKAFPPLNKQQYQRINQQWQEGFKAHRKLTLAFTPDSMVKHFQLDGRNVESIIPVLNQMLKDGEIQPVKTVKNTNESISLFGKLIRLMSPAKPPSISNGQTYFNVHLIQELADWAYPLLLSEEVCSLDTISTMLGLQSVDAEAICQYLSEQGKCKIHETEKETIYKFSGESIHESDICRAQMKAAMRNLSISILHQEYLYNKLTIECKNFLAAGQKEKALQALHMRKRHDQSIRRLSAQKLNLYTVLGHLETAMNINQIHSCMLAANDTLKSLQSSVDISEIEDLQDDLAESMSQVQLTDDALSKPIIPGAEYTEEELDQMLKELESEEK